MNSRVLFKQPISENLQLIKGKSNEIPSFFLIGRKKNINYHIRTVITRGEIDNEKITDAALLNQQIMDVSAMPCDTPEQRVERFLAAEEIVYSDAMKNIASAPEEGVPLTENGPTAEVSNSVATHLDVTPPSEVINDDVLAQGIEALELETNMLSGTDGAGVLKMRDAAPYDVEANDFPPEVDPERTAVQSGAILSNKADAYANTIVNGNSLTDLESAKNILLNETGGNLNIELVEKILDLTVPKEKAILVSENHPNRAGLENHAERNAAKPSTSEIVVVPEDVDTESASGFFARISQFLLDIF